jgi:rRNA maturation RNase YbeY
LISIDTINTNSEKYKVSVENEIVRVIIHGVLHLSGYKDKTAQQKKVMKAQENFYLEKIFKTAV